jgi:ribosome-associated protein
MITVTEHIAIPEHELSFTASRSRGPGGQHVNKVSSRVTLRFNVMTSPSLSDAQKHQLLAHLSTRISKEGVLQVVSQDSRSQAANRQATVARFIALLREGLTPALERQKTTVPPAVGQRRLEEKRHHSRLKHQRTPTLSWEE